jgi:hypothetical protein
MRHPAGSPSAVGLSSGATSRTPQSRRAERPPDRCPAPRSGITGRELPAGLLYEMPGKPHGADLHVRPLSRRRSSSPWSRLGTAPRVDLGLGSRDADG